MNRKTITIQTYNMSAAALAAKFDAIGPRVVDIEAAFAHVAKANPAVCEIGCGNGRDAAAIVQRTNQYVGIDISESLIALARQKVPDAYFEIADVESYVFPHELDIIFAFASLIHVPRESLREVMLRARSALGVGGVMRMSMKHADRYREVTKTDEFGERTYYHYSQDDIVALADGFDVVMNDMNEAVGQTWVEVLLRKSNIA